MRAFGFFERKDPYVAAQQAGDARFSVPGMALTGPVPLDDRHADVDAYGIAVLQQSIMNTSELSQLAYGAVREQDALNRKTQNARYKMATKLQGPRIGQNDGTTYDDGREQYEHLIIRDESLPAFLGENDDVAYAMALKPEERRRDKLVGSPIAGRIVGHAEWMFKPKDWVQKLEEQKSGEISEPPLAGTNVALLDLYESKKDVIWKKHMAGTEHYGV